MDDAHKTKAQLIQDLATLRQRVAALESAETARSQAEAVLRERDARSHALLETTIDGVITIDERGMIESFNPAAERLFGYPAAEVIGHNVRLLMPSPYREEHDRYVAHYLETGEKRIIGIGREVVGQRKDGTTFPMDLAVSEVRWNHQRLFLGIVRDITERKRAEEAMQHADRLALIGQFTSGLAHEIGTPLNVIAGNAELLRMDLHERGIPTETVDAIIGQTDRITGLIKQLLHFGRAHDQSLAPLAVQVPLSRAMQLVEPRLRHEGITPIVEVPDDLPLVLGVADHLEQVFLNVLVNGWHALSAGGTITIQADVPDEHCVRIVVQDTGVGMSAEEMAHALEPFYSTKGEQGTGLGLAMCRQIIERHGGTIRLDSTPGAGTTVTMALVQVDAVDEGTGRTRLRTPEADTVS